MWHNGGNSSNVIYLIDTRSSMWKKLRIPSTSAINGHHCDIKNNKTENSVAAHFNIPGHSSSDLTILDIEKVRSWDPTVNGWEPEEAPGDEAKSVARLKRLQLNSVQSYLKLYTTTTTICKACNCYDRYTVVYRDRSMPALTHTPGWEQEVHIS